MAQQVLSHPSTGFNAILRTFQPAKDLGQTVTARFHTQEGCDQCLWPELRVSSSAVSPGASLQGLGSGLPSTSPHLLFPDPARLPATFVDLVVILLDSSKLSLLLSGLLTSRALLKIPLQRILGWLLTP